MADAIRKELDLDPQLIPSSGGVFEVVADGELVFSKRSLGRFPEDDSEVISRLS